MASFTPKFGRGRGLGSPYNYLPPMEMYDSRLGRPVKSWINPDPTTGCYKLHVRNIPKGWTKAVLENIFSNFGEPLQVYVGQPPLPNAMVKWAFVEFATFQEARLAVTELNNNDNYNVNNIEVSFAREKQDISSGYFDDDNFENMLPVRKETPVTKNKSPSVPADQITRVIHNDKVHNAKLSETHCVIRTSSRVDRIIERHLLKQVVKSDKEDVPPKGKCGKCQVEAFLACQCDAEYCSTECQTKDWPDHSRNCRPLSESSDRSSVRSDNGGGDNNLTRSASLTNGCRNSERDDQSDSRGRDQNHSGRSNNRFSDGSNSRFENRSNNRSDDRQNGRDNRGGNRSDFNRNEEQRNMYEERKSRLASKRNDGSENSSNRSFGNNQSGRGGNYGSRNNRQSFNTRDNNREDEDWDSGNQKPDIPVAVTSPNSVRQQPTPMQPAVRKPHAAQSRLTLGEPETVIISNVVGDGSYFVQLKSQLDECLSVTTSINNEKDQPKFSPVENGICIAPFEGYWYRCKITTLTPLTVWFMDYGNSENVSADELRCVPPAFASQLPYAVKIQLAEGTPDVYLKKTDEDEMLVKPVLQNGDLWVVQIVGEKYPTTEYPKTESLSLPVSTQQAPVVSNPILPADIFTEVLVKRREPKFFSVTPTVKVDELRKLTENIQNLAISAALISPKAMDKCIIKSAKDNKWYRGRVVREIVGEESTVEVKLVDEGGFETIQYSPSNLKALPTELETVKPLFVTYIKPDQKEKIQDFSEDIVAVKPLYKDPSDQVWVVDVKAVARAETIRATDAGVGSSPTTPSVATPAVTTSADNSYPMFMPPGRFSTVVVSTVDKTESVTGDLYYVGPRTLMATLTEMSGYFDRRFGICGKIKNIVPGTVGISLFSDDWYRSKVLSVDPLKVSLIDYGVVTQITQDNLRECPETYKDMKPLVQRIRLTPGTDTKYFNLPEESELSVKPSTLLANNTFLVEVEGETYSNATKQDIQIPTSKPESISSQKTNNAQETSLSVAEREPQTPLTDSRAPAAEPQFPDIFERSGYTSVTISYSVPNEAGPTDTYYVGPTSSWEEDSAKITLEVNDFAKESPVVITPQLNNVYLSSFFDVWNRVRVVSLNPLKVFYIDFGNTELGDVLKECPEHLKTSTNPVHKIKLAAGTSEKYFGLDYSEGPTLSVKPVATLADNTVLVQVEGETYSNATKQDIPIPTSKPESISPKKTNNAQEPSSTSLSVAEREPQTPLTDSRAPAAEPQFPDIFQQSGYTSVIISYSVPNEAVPTDTYYVAPASSWEEDMGKITLEVINFAKESLVVVTPQLNNVYLSFFFDVWNRVRVVSLNPLKVFYIDFGNTELGDVLKECPEHLKTSKNPVHKIKLAAGTSEKYFGLDYSEGPTLSVKPVATLADNTVLVQVEGETYSNATKQDIPIPTSKPESISPKKTNNAQEPSSTSLSVAEREPQTPLTDSRAPAAEPQFPDIFQQSGYTSVIISYSVPNEAVPTDTYYVAPASSWEEDMGKITLEVINFAKESPVVITPQLNNVYLSFFFDVWNRVRVVSLNPLKVFYIDFGNTELGDVLKECPEHLKTSKNPVHKIKLAAGTSEKYFGLDYSEGPTLSVKPVAMLPGEITVVQVEGESYSQENQQRPVVVGSTGVEHSITSVDSNTAVVEQPAPQVTSNTVVEQPIPVEASSTVVDTRKETDHVINLLSDNWTVSFLPHEIEPTTHELMGTLYTHHLPETQRMSIEEIFNTVMDLEKLDSSFVPKEGEIVGCNYDGEWTRAKVTGESGTLALLDYAMFLRGSPKVKRLPQEFALVPHLGAVFKVPHADEEMLNKLYDMVIELKVLKCSEEDGERRVQVRGMIDTVAMFGVLRRWKCNSSPEIAYPLADGDLVMFSRLLDSNTAIVSLIQHTDSDIQHTVQNVCYRNCSEALKTAPNVGDYLAMKWETLYHRVKVERVCVEDGECTVFKVDCGSQDTRPFSSFYPLPSSLLKLFRRAVKVQLEGVEKLERSEMTEESKMYIDSIMVADRPLKITLNKGLVTLLKNDENVNKKLKALIKPTLTGKLTVYELPYYKPPLNVELTVFVAHEEPLHIHIQDVYQKFVETLNKDIQTYGQSENALYNPSKGELCLVKYDFEGSSDWYRSVCMKETNLGLSLQLLLDYGTVVNVLTKDIRQMKPELLTTPALGLHAVIVGVSDEDKVVLANKLKVYSSHQVIIESIDEQETCHVRLLNLNL